MHTSSGEAVVVHQVFDRRPALPFSPQRGRLARREFVLAWRRTGRSRLRIGGGGRLCLCYRSSVCIRYLGSWGTLGRHASCCIGRGSRSHIGDKGLCRGEPARLLRWLRLCYHIGYIALQRGLDQGRQGRRDDLGDCSRNCSCNDCSSLVELLTDEDM